MSMMNPQAAPLQRDEDILIMGYIAAGSSAYDLLIEYMKRLTTEEKNDILNDVDIQEKELEGVKECYRDSYKNLLEQCNTTITDRYA